MSVEVEKKYLLTSDEYYALSKSHFEGAIIQEQLNYYFDSLDFSLLKRGITLRIREKANNLILTIKRKISINDVIESEENDFLISRIEFMEAVLRGEFPKKVEQKLNVLIPKKKIFYLGLLKTQRLIKEKDSILYCLDRNTYFDKQDFELEIEGTRESLQKVSVDIPEKKFNRVGKYSRFISELLKGNGNSLIKIQVSAIILNEDKDEVCLIKKNAPTSSVHNIWIPPGGHVDIGEDLLKAVKRETIEETGLEVEILALSSVVSFQIQQTSQAICFFYLVEAKNCGEITMLEPGMDCKWFNLADVTSGNITNLTDYHKLIISNSKNTNTLYLDLEKKGLDYKILNSKIL